MKQQKNSQIKLDEYNNISLWQLLPAGDGLGLKKLRSIVNSVLHGQAQRESNKPMSLLITGQTGKKTHGFATLRALGLTNINHICANLLQLPKDIVEYFCNSSPDSGYIISNINLLPASMQKKIYQIMQEGEHRSMDPYKMKVESTPVFGIILATAKNEKLVPQVLRNTFDYHCELRTYTEQQKQLICLQRLKYSNIEIEDERVLQTLLINSTSDLYDLIKLLKLSIVVMMGEGRNVLTSSDVRKGKELW